MSHTAGRRQVTLSVVGSDIDHPECVAWDPVSGWLVTGTEAGGLLWLDPASGEVRRSLTVGRGFIGGLALDAAGRVYACDVAERRVLRADPTDGSVVTWSGGPTDAPFLLPNYPVFDATGRLWVSDSGDWGSDNGRLVVIEADGRTARVVSTEANGFTNGLAIDPSGDWLYVAESTPPLVSRLRILADGMLGPREVVLEMPRTVPDGLAFTADGGLLISCYRPDAVYLWDGQWLDPLAEDWSGIVLIAPTNVAFSGPELDTLWAANLGGGHLTRLDAGLIGSPLRYPAIGS